jgi:hypothetical protein
MLFEPPISKDFDSIPDNDINRSMARKPKPTATTRDKQILIRCTHDERQLARALALHMGASVQDMVRALIQQTARAYRVSPPQQIDSRQLKIALATKPKAAS